MPSGRESGDALAKDFGVFRHDFALAFQSLLLCFGKPLEDWIDRDEVAELCAALVEFSLFIDDSLLVRCVWHCVVCFIVGSPRQRRELTVQPTKSGTEMWSKL